jgi:hypothetical protein
MEKPTISYLSRPTMNTAVDALKIELGLKGRADFHTYRDDWPGDIIYFQEKVSVIILNCWQGGCKEHVPPQSIPAWLDIQRRTKRIIAATVEEFARMNWNILVFWACEALQNTPGTAESIISTLQVKKREVLNGYNPSNATNLTKAMIARLDAEATVGIAVWTRFIDLLTVQGKDGSRDAITEALLHEGWPKETVSAVWRLAAHHQVIRKSRAPVPGYGYLLSAVQQELGIQKEIPHVKLRRNETGS